MRKKHKPIPKLYIITKNKSKTLYYRVLLLFLFGNINMFRFDKI